MIKIWLKFEGKIPNDSKVIMFTKDHTNNDEADNGDEEDNDRTKNNMSSRVRGGGGRHTYSNKHSNVFFDFKIF